MPTPPKPVEDTVMAMDADKLEIIMAMIVKKPAMKDALRMRNKDFLSTGRAAILNHVTAHGISFAEDKIVKWNRELELIYSKSPQ